MADHLVFTIFAPLGSWGSASPSSANAAHKATETVPTRSAVTGLLGAALGWPRSRLGELADSIYLAVRIDRAAHHQPVPDYHTIRKGEAPPPTAERWSRFDELRDELAGGSDTGAILSRREFLTEGLWTVCIRCRDGAPITETDVAAALRAPVYPLYAGRKAFPLGLPPDPEVIDAAAPVAALQEYGTAWSRHDGLAPWLEALPAPTGPLQVSADHDFPDLEVGATIERWLERRDHPQPVTLEDGRNERRFQMRREVHLSVPQEDACS